MQLVTHPDEIARIRALPSVPGDSGLPLIGHTLDVLTGALHNDRARYDKYGPVSKVNIFGIKAVQVQGPEACRIVLQNRDKNYASGWDFMIGPFFDRGLLILDLEEHHRHRRIMQSAFTNDRLERYLEPMNESLRAGLAKWPDDPRFKIYPAVKQLILDVATSTFMGGELGPEATRVNAAFEACVEAGAAVVRRNVPGGRWSRGLAARKELEAYLRPQLPAKRLSDEDDLFSALCHASDEDGKQFSDDDVINHMIFTLMAAHDTTTITMTSMIHQLAKHPEWQDRCRKEALAIGTPTLAYADRDRLPVIEQVMKESLRFITPVPGAVRRTTRDTDLLGHFVPAGTMVMVNLQGLHQLQEYWPNPHRFDPGRFSPERREDKLVANSFLPFGHGAHKCIGMIFGQMQIKATMFQLLTTHQWSVREGYDMPINWTSLPKPRDGLPVRLRRL